MMVGDVVQIRLCDDCVRRLGIVEADNGSIVRTSEGAHKSSEYYYIRRVPLTSKQRAFVDATIAAEALRRIG